MLIQWYWPKCEYRNRRWGPEPIDSYWLEATKEEAEKHVFPLIDRAKIQLAHQMADRSTGHCHATIKQFDRPYCFLVAVDLSSIEPFEANYPVANLWNGYSPFRKIAEKHISELEVIKSME